MLRRILPLVLLLPLPLASGAADGPDFVVEIPAGGPPAYDGPEGWLVLNETSPGERLSWDLRLPDRFVVGEFRIAAGAFDVERQRQVVPLLNVSRDVYPLFEQYPDERVWEAEGGANVFRIVPAENGSWLLRLGMQEPRNATLVLARDVEPPGFTLGPVEQLSPRSFYQESRTDELALADLQRRAQGETEWIRNPTAVYHVLQRFPIQGLDPGTTYETRFVFTDWAGNEAASGVALVRTPLPPAAPRPVVEPLSPARNATVPAAGAVVQARVDGNGSAVAREDVRVFFDLREVTSEASFADGVVTYRPGTLAPGLHVASVEATNAAGGSASAQWRFTVEDARGAPVPAWAALLAPLAALALRRR